ncbi:MAG: haloacid dehalogenase-like hydrolase [Bacilli bacterium]|nr:haloacid dehalogenase-like hydrolase [Bacilli bacterium]
MKQEKIIIYDFDGTLTPYSSPKFEILERCGLRDGANGPSFLELSQKEAEASNIDLYEAIYKVYFELIYKAGFRLVDKNFCLGFDKVEYNKGVEYFLTTLVQSDISNYLISSGVSVFLQKTKYATLFKKIYATTFKYNERQDAIGISYLMSDKKKVEAIKEIIKDHGFSEEDCSHVIYIGDGLTDFYAMDYVKAHGGTTIFVYLDNDTKAIQAMKQKDVVSFFAKADFSQNSELSKYVFRLCGISNIDE